jgi:Protein of unknown function (DUF2971)
MPSEPERLFHYTDARGLIGIVQSRALWATHAEFLNDAQELRFGRETLHRALMRRSREVMPRDPSDLGPDYSRATIMRSAADALRTRSRRRFQADPSHAVYVSCFCAEDDLLSQWRGYGAAGGFAIGFSRSALGQLGPVDAKPPSIAAPNTTGKPRILEPANGLTMPPLPVSLARVHYGRQAVKTMIEQVFQEIAPTHTGHPGATGYGRVQTVIMPALAKIKDDAFSEEKEWRLITVGSPAEVCFRPGSLGVIPYIKLAFEPTTIEEVVIGPGAHMELREQGVGRLLGESWLDGVTVTRSKAPFRG